MKLLNHQTILTSSLIIAISLTAGCSAIGTAIKHRNLDVQTKTSNTIFLDPTPKAEHVIYVQVKDTSGTAIRNHLADKIEQNLMANGWTVTDDVALAKNMVQVNVLQVGEAPAPESVWANLKDGFGSAVVGGLAGVGAGIATSSVPIGVGVGAGVGGISWIADQFVESVTYSMISDVQISVRSKAKVKQKTNADLSQGTSTQTVQVVETESDWVRYRVRVGSTANQVNLELDDAKPELVKQQSSQISGILG
jgi:hypothetical protein